MGLQDDDLFLAGTWEKDIDKFGKGIDMIVTKYGELMKVSRETKLSFGADGAANVKQQLEQSRLATAQYKEEVAKLQLEIGKLNKAQQEAAKTTTLQARAEQQETKSIREKTKALADELKYKQQLEKAIAKEEAAVKKQQSAYQLLNAEYQKRAAKAKDLAVIYGTEDTMAKRAADSANKLADQLKKIDATVGQSQRNVGNYKSQWNGVNNSIQQLVREVPSVSGNLAMLPLALSNNIGPLIDSLKAARLQNNLLKESGQATIPVWKQVAGAIFSWQTALAAGLALLIAYLSTSSAATKKIGDFGEALKSSANSFGEARFELEAYKKAFEDTTTTMAQKEAMLEHYNKTWGDQAGKLKTVNDLERWLVEKSSAFINVLFLRAKATAAIAAATELYTEQLKNAANGGKDLVSIFDKFESFSKSLFTDPLHIGDNMEWDKTVNGLARVDMETRKVDKSVAVLQKTYLDTSKEAADMAKKMGFDMDGSKNPKDPKGKQPTDLNNTLVQAQKEINEAVHQVLIEGLEADRDTNKQYADDEKNALQDRINAYENYAFFRESIADEQRKKELEDNEIHNDKILHDIDTANTSQAEKNKILVVQAEAFAEQKVAIQAKYDGEVSKIATDGIKDRQQMAESDIKEQLRVIMQGAQDIENQVRESENRKLVLLNTQYKTGLIDYKAYQNERKRITSEADIDIFNAQKTYFENYLDELERSGVLTIEVVKKIKEQLAKELPATGKGKEKTSIGYDLIKSIFPELDDTQINSIVKSYSTAISTIYSSLQSIAANKFAAEIDRLEEEKNAIKDRYEYERDQIQYTYKTQEERAAALSDLQARTQIREADAQRRINDRKRKQAQAEKQAAAFEATARGAVAIITAFRDLGPIAGAIAAVAVGAAIAAQLAAINSAPLPEYYKGTDSAKAGLAHVGERGAELMVGKNGIELIPDHQIRNLQGGEKIFTADETNQILKSGALGGSVRKSNGHNEWVYYNALLTNNDKNSRRLEKAIRETKPNIRVIQRDSSYISRIIRN